MKIVIWHSRLIRYFLSYENYVIFIFWAKVLFFYCWVMMFGCQNTYLRFYSFVPLKLIYIYLIVQSNLVRAEMLYVAVWFIWGHSWCGKFCYSMVGSRRVWWEFMCLSSYISLFGDLLRWDRSLYSLSTGGFILLVVAHAWFFPVKFSTWKSCLLFYCCSCFDFLDCWPLYISLLFPVS